MSVRSTCARCDDELESGAARATDLGVSAWKSFLVEVIGPLIVLRGRHRRLVLHLRIAC